VTSHGKSSPQRVRSSAQITRPSLGFLISGLLFVSACAAGGDLTSVGDSEVAARVTVASTTTTKAPTTTTNKGPDDRHNAGPVHRHNAGPDDHHNAGSDDDNRELHSRVRSVPAAVLRLRLHRRVR
jgi:hypothetical protein